MLINNESQKKTAISILSNTYDKNTIKYLSALIGEYDKYYFIDSDFIQERQEYGVNIVKTLSRKCEEKGCVGSTYDAKNRKIFHCSSRDRALFYFKYVKNYDYVWMIEDDVFIPSLNTLNKIDLIYKNYDLISPMIYAVNSNSYNKSAKKTNFKYSNQIDPNWFWTKHAEQEYDGESIIMHSLVCAIRVSYALIDIITKNANKETCLKMDETLFASTASTYDLSAIQPDEMSGIEYKQEIDPNDAKFLRQEYLYHPVKGFKAQSDLRSLM